jgi:hypothetical protein
VGYEVGSLASLWWTDDMSRFSMDAKDEWKWTPKILQPDVVTRRLLRTWSSS